jgi:hypothetical protein
MGPTSCFSALVIVLNLFSWITERSPYLPRQKIGCLQRGEVFIIPEVNIRSGLFLYKEARPIIELLTMLFVLLVVVEYKLDWAFSTKCLY